MADQYTALCHVEPAHMGAVTIPPLSHKLPTKAFIYWETLLTLPSNCLNDPDHLTEGGRDSLASARKVSHSELATRCGHVDASCVNSNHRFSFATEL